MLKPKKGFIIKHINPQTLTKKQWIGILRAMDDYAEHYHNHKTTENIENFVIKYQNEKLPNRSEEFHHEAEICSGLNDFVLWLKSNIKNIKP